MRAACVVPILVAALGGEAKADEGETRPMFPGVRTSLTFELGVAEFHRSSQDPSSQGGLYYGLDLRVHPWSQHGFLFGASRGGGLFGPTVDTLDAGYSFGVSTRNGLGSVRTGRAFNAIGGAVYVDVGPSFGSVSLSRLESTHHVLGGRASLVLDVTVWNVVGGVSFTYRGGGTLGGVPDAWEGGFYAGAHLGLAIDLATRR